MFSVDITPKDEQRRGQASGKAKTRQWAEIPRRTSRHDQSTNERKKNTSQEAAGNLTLTLRWRHYYRCPSCHEDWAHIDDASKAIGACPFCSRKMWPYESEICIFSQP